MADHGHGIPCVKRSTGSCSAMRTRTKRAHPIRTPHAQGIVFVLLLWMHANLAAILHCCIFWSQALQGICPYTEVSLIRRGREKGSLAECAAREISQLIGSTHQGSQRNKQDPRVHGHQRKHGSQSTPQDQPHSTQ